MLEDIKDYLKINWSSEDSDIQNSIYRGMSYLDEKVGIKLDYQSEGQSRNLLFDYCRYDYNRAIEYFKENFQSDILRLQLLKAGEKYVADKAK